MENATDALKMAASVLIFVLALSICISAFGQVRQTSQIVLDYKDREYQTEYIEGDNTERQVGIEAIIPTIYKSYTENYKVVFSNYILFEKRNSSGIYEEINYIDLENGISPDKGLGLGSENDKREFIEAILYGANNETQRKFLARGIRLPEEGLYSKINGQMLKEKLGVYYQEELQQDESNTPDANKTKKRVITYSK